MRERRFYDLYVCTSVQEAAAQPAIAEEARMLERQFGEFDLEAIEDVGRDLAVFGEETDLFGELSGFVERVQILAPGGLLRVIDLAQIENGALRGVAGAQAAVLDDAPVAMRLAVLFASVETQEHLLAASVSRSRRTVAASSNNSTQSAFVSVKAPFIPACLCTVTRLSW